MTWIGRGTARGEPPPNAVHAVLAFEPPPALVTDPDDVRAMLYGAWTWSCRHVFDLKLSRADSAKGRWLTKDQLAQATDLFRGKDISPSAWVVWRACKMLRSPPTKPPALSAVVSVRWLADSAKRNWYRSETVALFGGRARIVGDPPGPLADSVAVAAYQAHAHAEKARLEETWTRNAAKFGALFPNADPREVVK